MRKPAFGEEGCMRTIKSGRGHVLLERHCGSFTVLFIHTEATTVAALASPDQRPTDDLSIPLLNCVIDPMFHDLRHRQDVMRDLCKQCYGLGFNRAYKQALFQADHWFAVQSGPSQTLLGRYVGGSLHVTLFKDGILRDDGSIVVFVDDQHRYPIHFSFPAPIYSCPRELHPHPVTFSEDNVQALKSKVGIDAWRKPFFQAYKKAVGVSTVEPEEEEEEEEPNYRDQLFPTMVHAYLNGPHAVLKLDEQLSSMILSIDQEIKEKGKGVKRTSEPSPRTAEEVMIEVSKKGIVLQPPLKKIMISSSHEVDEVDKVSSLETGSCDVLKNDKVSIGEA